MKLRLQNNSVRLRLSDQEVSELASSGRVEESVAFGAGGILAYEIVLDDKAAVISARLVESRIIVTVPTAAAKDWASGGDVVLQCQAPQTLNRGLSVAIEKDLGRRSVRTV